MRPATRDALVSRLSAVDGAVEIGIGRRTDVAAELADSGVHVTATDVRQRSVPAGVDFVVDDVTAPDVSVYAGAELIYALNLPPELQEPAAAVAREVGATFQFTTLGGDPAVVRVRRESIPADTLYTAIL